MKLLKKMKESGNNLKILTIMKKILLAAAAALTALVACQKNEVAAPAADSVLYATIEETDATILLKGHGAVCATSITYLIWLLIPILSKGLG